MRLEYAVARKRVKDAPRSSTKRAYDGLPSSGAEDVVDNDPMNASQSLCMVKGNVCTTKRLPP